MDLGHLSLYYRQQNDLYKTYLEKSKWYKYIQIGFFIIFLGSMALQSLEVGFTSIPSLPWSIPIYDIFKRDPIVFAGIVIGAIGFVVSNALIAGIKEDCSYDSIQFEYISMYESLSSYTKYAENNVSIHKKESVDLLNKSYETIDEWDYGNIPLVPDGITRSIDYIKTDLKQIIIDLINSENKEDQNKVRNLMIEFLSFIKSKDIEHLKNFNSEIQKYEDYEIITTYITNKERLKNIIQNHEILSQILFTLFTLLLVYSIGLRVNASTKEMIPWYIATIGTSLPLFGWIKKAGLQIQG